METLVSVDDGTLPDRRDGGGVEQSVGQRLSGR
jgi:hypothetical protein